VKRKYLRTTMILGTAFLLITSYTESYAHATSERQFNTKQSLSSEQQLSKNDRQQDVAINRIKSSEKQIEKIKRSVADKQSKLVESEAISESMKDQIDRLTKQISIRDKLLKERIRSIYINGGAISYLDVLLGADSFGNFLDRLFALKLITETDNKILTAQEKDKKDQVSKQKILKQELINLKNGLADLKKLENDLLQKQKDQKNELALLRKEASKIKEKSMDKKEEKDIVKAQTSSAENRASTLSLKKLSLNKSDFINPTQGYISSGFGNRSFDNSFHPGIDIANSEGTPVKAAADGVVFRAYQSSSYGNTVMVSHQIDGKLYTTVYAHLNAYNVSTGERVTQGQVIGGMGNTGESFGSHLHFELYIGPWTPPPHKGAVNPVSYIQ